jgi:hypothetical protein
MPSRVTFSTDDILRSKIVPPGWYSLLVKSMSEEQAGTDGSDLYVYRLIVQGGGDPKQGDVKGVPLRFQISEKGLSFGVEFLQACGQEVKNGVPVELAKVVGANIEGFVQRGEYKGRPTNELVSFRSKTVA